GKIASPAYPLLLFTAVTSSSASLSNTPAVYHHPALPSCDTNCFPALYVPDSNERILLYRELDSITNERDLLTFRNKMQDRFGKIPTEGEELIRMVTLRRKAQELGIEKIYLKGGKMSLFFVDNRCSTFYNSDTFGKIISYLPLSSFTNQMREGEGRCIITVNNIKSVETGLNFIEEMQRHILLS
ncbi:MAG: hypothetical protein IKA41_03030, partial [Bacteroidaceae bacterium]|nr:hypothetical protein [Bacteroidaceae bacterium]